MRSISQSAARLGLLLVSLCAANGASAQTAVFVNELHYDNSGSDTGEAIEIAGPAGTDLNGWSIVLYNGNGGAAYNSAMLSGVLADDTGSGFGFVDIEIAGIQNGSPDGIALINALGDTVQFLSYEGAFTAVGGPADGLLSTDIGIAESSGTPVGSSLQLVGEGTTYENFTWTAADETFCASNTNQTFAGATGECDTAPPPPPPPPPSGSSTFINELHYDNAGGDTGEFVEVAGAAGTNLAGWSLVFYNGNGGASYASADLTGVLNDDTGTGFGFAAAFVTGIQNGSPDGVALVDASGAVIEFLSYEGSFTAVNGPAQGMTSVDIGVFESSSTPVGDSLQLIGSGSRASDFQWSPPGSATPGAANNGQSFGGSLPTITRIFDIQGSGASSPLVGQEVTVVGVVTGDFQDSAGSNGDLNGFYLQEAMGDGDAATSDGIYVFDGFRPDVDVAIGDIVEVSGSVAEFFGETQINASGSGGSVAVRGTGSVAPTPVSLPAADTFLNRDGEWIADLEQYEGMLVELVGSYQVTDLFELDRFGEVRLAAGERFRQFTQDNFPDAAGFAAHQRANAARLLILDDGNTVQNPDPIVYPAPALAADNPIRMGDLVSGLRGNIRFSRGSGGSGDEAYRLEPVVTPTVMPLNLRESAPDVGGRLKVASMNVLNFFTTIDQSGASCFPSGTRSDCRGADNQAEYERQLEKLVTQLSDLDADIIGLVELENNYGAGADSAIETLVAALNDRGATSCPHYAVAHPGVPNLGSDAIAVGLVYCTATAAIADGSSVAILDDDQLPALGLRGPVFDGPRTSRAVVAATFVERSSGEYLSVAVNHFKSKGRGGLSCPTPDASADCDQGDGAGFFDESRTAAAEALLAWLASDPTGCDVDSHIILGDLNAYAKEDPIQVLENSGYSNVLGSDPGAYSFVFDGQLGSLDYALVSPALAGGVTGAADWHANADEADALDYNLDFGRNPGLFDGGDPYRASDHDPVVVGLNLPDSHAPTLYCNAPETAAWQPGDVLSFTPSATDKLDAEPDVVVFYEYCESVAASGEASKYGNCGLEVDGDTIRVLWSGEERNRVRWTVEAKDAEGNLTLKDCSVEVVAPGG